MAKYKKQELSMSDGMLDLLDRSGLATERKRSKKPLFGGLACVAALSAALYGSSFINSRDAYSSINDSTFRSYATEQPSTNANSSVENMVTEERVARNPNNSPNLEKRLKSKSLAERFKALNEQYPLNEELIQNYIKTAIEMTPNLSSEITPEFVRYIVRIESTDQPNVISRSGARGLGQHKEATWDEISKERQDVYGSEIMEKAGVEKMSLPFDCAFDPYTSIEMTVGYLNSVSQHIQERNRGWKKYSQKQKQDAISAAYNAGPTGLRNAGYKISEMRLETRNYIKKLDKLRKNGIEDAWI